VTGTYFLSDGINFCEGMDDSFAQVVFRTPDSSIHNARFASKCDDLDYISSRAFDWLNIKPSSKSSRQGTTDVNWNLTVMAVDGGARGVLT
jgi:hypothetical protein